MTFVRRHTAPACLIVTSLLVLSGQTAPPRDLNLTVGRGELMQFPADVVRVAISEPKIADAIVVSPREVMINAKGVGKASVVIWEAGSIPARYNINVVPDLSNFESIKRNITSSFADTQISVTGNEETLVLAGSVKDAAQSKQAEALASTHAKKVINLLVVPPPAEPRQILLQVKFASVDRAGLSELGFNIFSTNDKAVGELSTQQFQSPRFAQLQLRRGDLPNTSVNFADLLNLFAFRPDLSLGGTIRALASKNLLQILAEPNLIVVEGKEANFLAGGEFPFPTIQSTTTGGAISPVITVRFRRFGIELTFTPTILPSGAINLKVKPEVSSLDFSNATQLQGFLIPALSTRTAETEVILRDGESFAIAGLIDNRVIQTLSRLRGIGDIPIIGNLFRSRSTRKSTDELLVVVTPRFVKPIAAGDAVKLPDYPEAWLPTIAEQRGKKNKNDKKKQAEIVGPRGSQEPKD